jgi:hypothetical protein
MRKIILLFAVILLLVSCAKVPQEKIDIAKHCLDSLVDNGAKNSIAYYDLLDRMKNIDAEIEIQNSKLFKKFDVVKSALDYVTNAARTFVITNDRPDAIEKARRGVPLENSNESSSTITKSRNPNVVRLEVEITFDSEQDALKIASQVDDAVRHNMNLNAKLISVKIIE